MGEGDSGWIRIEPKPQVCLTVSCHVISLVFVRRRGLKGFSHSPYPTTPYVAGDACRPSSHRAAHLVFRNYIAQPVQAGDSTRLSISHAGLPARLPPPPVSGAVRDIPPPQHLFHRAASPESGPVMHYRAETDTKVTSLGLISSRPCDVLKLIFGLSRPSSKLRWLGKASKNWLSLYLNFIICSACRRTLGQRIWSYGQTPLPRQGPRIHT